MVFSTTAVISKKPIRLFKKGPYGNFICRIQEHKANFPLFPSASVANTRFLKVFISGSSKFKFGYFPEICSWKIVCNPIRKSQRILYGQFHIGQSHLCFYTAIFKLNHAVYNTLRMNDHFYLVGR